MLWGIGATLLLLPRALHLRLLPSLGPKYRSGFKHLLQFLDCLLQMGFSLLAGAAWAHSAVTAVQLGLGMGTNTE